MLACVAAPPSSAASVPPVVSTPALPAHTFGVNARSVYDLGPSAWGPHLDAIASNGLAVVRSDLSWAALEPAAPSVTGQHAYDWAPFDQWVHDLAVRGIRWQPLLGYSAPWAATGYMDQYSAPNPFAYATYVAAVAQRYGRGGSYRQLHPELKPMPITTYEVWNEPNLERFWNPGCNAPAYGQVFAAAQPALKQVDPQAVAVVGGLSSSPDNLQNCSPATFMKDLASVDPTVTPTITAVGLHPYDTYYTNSEYQIQSLRWQLDAIGLSGASIYVTEIGWTDAGSASSIPDDAASPPNRTDAYTQIANRWPVSDCKIRNVMVYTWLSAEQNPNDLNDWWGIASPQLDASGNVVLDDSAKAYTSRAAVLAG